MRPMIRVRGERWEGILRDDIRALGLVPRYTLFAVCKGPPQACGGRIRSCQGKGLSLSGFKVKRTQNPAVLRIDGFDPSSSPLRCATQSTPRQGERQEFTWIPVVLTWEQSTGQRRLTLKHRSATVLEPKQKRMTNCSARSEWLSS